MPPVQSHPSADDRPGAPSFQQLGPLLDRLVEHAEELLPTYTVRVIGSDDGDVDAYAYYSAGTRSARVEYDTGREAIVHKTLETDRDTGEAVDQDETVLEEYECPVPVVE